MRSFAKPRAETTWAATPVLILLSVLVLPPLWFLFEGSFVDADSGRTTLGNFAKIFGDDRFIANAGTSLFFAGGTALVALLFGWVSAWIVERTNAPLKNLTYLTAITSLGTPYVLYVGAWLLLASKSGPINQLYRSLTGSLQPLIDIYSLPGMIAIEGFLWSPLAFLLVGASLRNANPELEEAARISGAGVGATLRRITLRLSLPVIAALAMLVVIRALEAFEVPALVGLPGRIYVLTTDIYRSMQSMPPSFGEASAFSVLLLALVLGLLYAHGQLTRAAERFAVITGRGFRPRPFDLGRLRLPAAVFLAINFVLLLVVPMTMLVWVSLLPFYQPPSVAAFSLLTLENFRTVLSPEYLQPVVNTVMVAATAATVTVALTAVAAWLAQHRSPLGWTIERLAMLPLVFPGLVLGVGVIQLFLAVPLPIYGTLWILIWAFIINYLPYGMRYGAAGLLQIHHELEEAAAISGAPPLVRLRRIVLPLLAPSLIAAWLFIFLMGARVLSLAVLLAGPQSQTMAVAMFDLWTNGQGTELAALGLLWTCFMGAIAAVFHALARRAAPGAFAAA